MIPYIVASVRQRRSQYRVFWKKYPVLPGNIGYAAKFAIPLMAVNIGYLLFVPYVVNCLLPPTLHCRLKYILDCPSPVTLCCPLVTTLYCSRITLCCPLISTLYCPMQATLYWPLQIYFYCSLQNTLCCHYKVPYTSQIMYPKCMDNFRY